MSKKHFHKHDHSHTHDHHHDHSPKHSSMSPKNGSEKRLFLAMILTGSFMLVEAIGGLISGSLALLSDSFHMLTDLSSLALAWFAVKISRKPSDHKRSYGYHRMEVLAAFINGLSLLVVVLWIVVEAVERLFKPHEVEGNLMLVISTIGLIVNLISLRILHHSHEENLNIKSAIIHVIGDLLSSCAAIVAAIVILWTKWMPIDPLLSILVALLILKSSWVIIKKAGHILLEGAPEKFVADQIKEVLKGTFKEILDVHHIHLWSLTSNKPIITLHLTIKSGEDHDRLLLDVKKKLNNEFGIAHSTIQVETEGFCPDHQEEAYC